MDTVLRIVGYVLLAASIAGLVVAVRVLRRETPVRTRFDVIRLGISLGSALLITAVLSVDTPPVVIGAALVAGAAVGFLQGQGMHVRIDGDQVFARRSVLAILAWGSGMIVAQGAGLLNRAGTVSIGLAVAYFSAAMVGGTMLGRNQAITKARIATAPAAAAVTVLFLLVAPFVPGGSEPIGAQAEGFEARFEADAAPRPEDLNAGITAQAVLVNTDGSLDMVLEGTIGGGGVRPRTTQGTFESRWTFFTRVDGQGCRHPSTITAEFGDFTFETGNEGQLVLEGQSPAEFSIDTCEGELDPGTGSGTVSWTIRWDPEAGTFEGSATADISFTFLGESDRFTVGHDFSGTAVHDRAQTAPEDFNGSNTPTPPSDRVIEVPAEIDIEKKLDLSEIDCGDEGELFFEECQRFADLTPEQAGFIGVPTNNIAFRIPEAGGEVTGDIDVVYEVDFVRLITGFVGETDTNELTDEERREIEEFTARECVLGLSVKGSFTGQYTPADGRIVGTANLGTATDRIISGCDFPPDPENPESTFEDELQAEPDETTAEIQATFDGSNINGTLITADGIAVVFGPPSDNEVSAGSAAGASLVGLVGVAGLLSSSMSEAGMSTAELTSAMRRDGLSGLGRLSPTTDPPPPPPPDLAGPTTTPRGIPEGVEATPSGSTPTPTAPDAGPAEPVAAEPDSAPGARSFRATADVSPDVAADAPPAPPDTAPDAPPGPSVEVAPDVVDFSGALPGAAGPREAIMSVGDSLADPAAFEAVDIDPQEAVDRLRTAGVGLRDSLNPISRLSDDVAAAIRENPVAGARGLIGADALDRLVDPDVPVGQAGGPDLFGAADAVASPEAAGGAGGAGILAGIDLDATGTETIADAGGASANSELLGDIGEDTSELMSDVVEDRALADRARPTGPPPGPNWAFRQLDASAAARLGLPPVALPVRADNADAVFGDPVATDRILGELDDYLAAHPDQSDSYGPIAAEIAYVVGVERGAAGSYGEAASHLRVGLQYAPDNLSLLIHYALAQQCLGDFEQASRVYERLERDRRLEHNALMKILAARAHAAAGEHDRARTVLTGLADDPAIRSLADRLGPNPGGAR